MHQHRIGGKQCREHHDVAEQKNPETIGNDDPLRSGAGFDWQRNIIQGNSDVHRTTSSSRLWSNLDIWSGVISISSSRRNAKASIAAKAPRTPKATIHQMCQISAKPLTTAKKAMTKPVALFFGLSIDL